MAEATSHPRKAERVDNGVINISIPKELQVSKKCNANHKQMSKRSRRIQLSFLLQNYRFPLLYFETSNDNIMSDFDGTKKRLKMV